MRWWLAVGFWSLLQVSASAADRFDKDRFLRTLLGRNEESKLLLLDRLRREFSDHAETPHLLAEAVRESAERLEANPKRQMTRSTFQIVAALGSHESASAEAALLPLLESPRIEVVIAACTAAREKRSPATLKSLRQVIDRDDFREHYGLRFVTLKALASIETRDSVALLQDLYPELTGRLRYEVWNYLQDEGVQKLLADSRRPDAASILGQTSGYQGVGSRGQQPYAQYYGIPIYADRLVFVFDRSGSMNRVSGGSSRLQRAKVELIQAIQQLPEHAHFNIITFASDVRQWQSELVAATAKNKTKAIRFVTRIQARTATSTYEALQKALALDNNTESIFLLSDGAPTRGRIVGQAAIVEAISATNAFRNCTLNTIGLDTHGATADFMGTLAGRNNGVYRGVY